MQIDMLLQSWPKHWSLGRRWCHRLHCAKQVVCLGDILGAQGEHGAGDDRVGHGRTQAKHHACSVFDIQYSYIRLHWKMDPFPLSVIRVINIIYNYKIHRHYMKIYFDTRSLRMSQETSRTRIL